VSMRVGIAGRRFFFFLAAVDDDKKNDGRKIDEHESSTVE